MKLSKILESLWRQAFRKHSAFHLGRGVSKVRIQDPGWKRLSTYPKAGWRAVPAHSFQRLNKESVLCDMFIPIHQTVYQL